MTTYRRLGGMEYAAIPLNEWWGLGDDLAEHNRKAMERAAKGPRKRQD